ncbi:hypothetical protein F1559_001567 [Cyanidiococcus yangmingshanensis]|uniref:Uncharacterized protein n=1 Tax=Cyanidiococcus yangmingshanensis TaxID=2690220 RepID=A0A7J7IPV8_9RHOD|nr:hypothetical protein F1559_001567 [Cyanidiococcus yangmingshanensis]
MNRARRLREDVVFLPRRQQNSAAEAHHELGSGDQRSVSGLGTKATSSSIETFWAVLAGKKDSVGETALVGKRKRLSSEAAVQKPNPYVNELLLSQVQNARQADRHRKLYQYVPGEWIRWSRELRALYRREQEWETWLRLGRYVTALAVKQSRQEQPLPGPYTNGSLGAESAALEPWDRPLLAAESELDSYEAALDASSLFHPDSALFSHPLASPPLVWLTPPTPITKASLDLMLPAERRRLRHQRRLQRRQELERLSKMRSHAAATGPSASLEARQARAGSAYSALDAESLRQIAMAMVTERMQQHEARNAASKRPSPERSMLRAQKRARDRSRELLTTAYAFYSDRMAANSIYRLIHHLSAMVVRVGLDSVILWRRGGLSTLADSQIKLAFPVFIVTQGGAVTTRKWDAFLQRRISRPAYNLTWVRIWQGSWTTLLPVALHSNVYTAATEAEVRKIVNEAQVAELYDVARAQFLLRTRWTTEAFSSSGFVPTERNNQSGHLEYRDTGKDGIGG